MTAVEFMVKEISEILGPLKTEGMTDLLLLDAYKKAKEMEKEQKGYSEEDVRKAYQQGEEDSYLKGGQTKEMENEFIQSLKQTKQDDKTN